DAAGDRKVDLAAADPARGIADGVEAGGAEPVDGDTRDRIGDAREQERHARDVAVVLAGLVGAAEHDLVEHGPVDLAVALEERPDRNRGEIVGADLGERAAIAPDRGSHRVADEHIAQSAHGALLMTPRPRAPVPCGRAARGERQAPPRSAPASRSPQPRSAPASRYWPESARA